MKSRLAFITIAAAVLAIASACGRGATTAAPAAPPEPTFEPITGHHKIEVRDRRIFVDGAPFYVRGVGYEAGCRPGRVPWKREFEPELLKWDFRQIRKAGFNTLRTWSPMTDSEISLAGEYGLWVIQGVWTDWNRYWTDSAYHTVALDQLRAEVLRGQKHPNVLFYLVMNEPPADLLARLDSGLVNRGFVELADAVHRADASALASFSNCPLTDFLDTGAFDIVCSNNYPYGPESLHHALGYDGYTGWIVRRAGSKPYVTTEFGLSVSPTGPGKWGYGGNTLAEQSDGVSSMYRTIAGSGAAGACPFMWIDGWWKSSEGGPGSENRHDSHPEEWFGFFDVSPQNLNGTARPVVAALTEANRLLVLSPAAGDVVSSAIPIRIVTAFAEKPQARVGAEPWVDLARDGEGEWSGTIAAPKSGSATVEIRCGDATRSVPVIAGAATGAPGRLTLSVSNASALEGTPIVVTGRLEDFTGASVESRTVFLTLHEYRSGGDRILSTATDSDGTFRWRIGTMGATGILGLAAGVEISSAGVTRRVGDLVFVRVRPNAAPEKLLSGLRPQAISAFELSNAKAAEENFREHYTGDADLEAATDRGSLLLKYKPHSAGAWIYIARALDKPVDLSQAAYLSYELSSTAPGTTVKVMLKDEDGERWFQGAPEAPGSKSRKIVWDIRSDMTRDPYDGAQGGDGRFDPDRVAGVSIVLTGSIASEIRFARLTAWK